MTFFVQSRSSPLERNRILWDSIDNAGKPIVNKAARNIGKARYTSTHKLIVTHFEQNKDLMCIAKMRTVLDVWLCFISIPNDKDENSRFKTLVPATGGLFLLSGSGCKAQLRHNDMYVRIGKSSGYCNNANCSEVGERYVCERSHHYVFYPSLEKTSPANLLKMNPIKSSPLFSLDLNIFNTQKWNTCDTTIYSIISIQCLITYGYQMLSQIAVMKSNRLILETHY